MAPGRLYLGGKKRKREKCRIGSIVAHTSQNHEARGQVLTVRGRPRGCVLLGTSVVDDHIVLVIGTALLPHFHHLHLWEGRAPLHHIFGAQRHQAAYFQLASAKGECEIANQLAAGVACPVNPPGSPPPPPRKKQMVNTACKTTTCTSTWLHPKTQGTNTASHTQCLPWVHWPGWRGGGGENVNKIALLGARRGFIP